MSDIVEGTEFQAVIEEPITGSAADIKKLIFCSGQFFYELKNTKEEKKLDVPPFITQNVAIVRV